MNVSKMLFSALFPPFKKWHREPNDFSKLIREDCETELRINKEEFQESPCDVDDDDLKSSEFPNSINAHFKWKLDFCPRGHTFNCPESCSVFLTLLWKRINIPVYIVTRLELLSENNSLISFKEMEYKYEEFGRYERKKLAEISEKYKRVRSSRGNSLILRLKISAFYETYSYAPSNVPSEKKLLRQLSNLLENGSFSDVVIRSNGTEFKAHRTILAARSDVFAAMLSAKMSENLTGEITINDLSEKGVKKMLKFIYCCEIHFEDVELTLDLLEASERYNLTDLKAQCVEYLSSTVNQNNAIRILLKADFYNLPDLKETVLKYICTHSKMFSSGQQYDMLLGQNPVLLKEVAKRLSKWVDLENNDSSDE